MKKFSRLNVKLSVFAQFVGRLHAFASICLIIAVATIASPQKKTLLTLDDLFAREDIGDVAISPDGLTLAFVKSRPLEYERRQPIPTLFSNDRADVWIVSARAGKPHNLTDGETDKSGWWAPIWSPDSKRLAMLSTKGGDVRLWVWEKATDRLTKVIDRGIAWYRGRWNFSWLDNNRLAVVLLPVGEQPLPIRIETGSAEIATEAWSKARAGSEVTASLLDSGVPPDLGDHPQQQTVVLDLPAGTVQSVAESVSMRDLRIAPDGQHFAFLKQIALMQPDPNKPVGWYERLGEAGARYQLLVVDSRGCVVIAGEPSVRYIEPGSFRWSRNANNFAFIGVQNGKDEGPYDAFRGSVDGSIERVPLPDCDPRSLVWADGDRLLVLAECDESSSGTVTKKTDWWLTTRGGGTRNLTNGLKKAPPNELVAGSAGGGLVGISDGDVWRLNVDIGEWTNLTQKVNPKINEIAWPEDLESRDVGFPRIVASVLRDSTTEYYVIDIASGGMRQIGHPSDSLKLMAYDSANDLALFLAAGPTGTYLTRVRADQQQAIASLNTFMRNINECQWRTFEYTSFEGQDLKAGLILPANFKVGQRYPLVTLVYGGAIVDERSRIALGGTINNSYSGADNAQLLAARGYLVLWPSIPLKPFPNGKNYKGSDPYLELTNGVLPAVEKVIEMGIADPQRLAVMGHSYGGYSVYGLVTQTNRFKAAISAAGFADLLSYFGTLSMASRYENFAHERNFSAMWAETGQGRMGNPPWKDLGRYLRNSPIIYVDRVQTPLLIIQGDLDSVAMQQGDEFFMALYRQGKRARFIRYWGEGHDISSPANIRDLWNQTYVWIDEFCDISRDEKGNLIFDGDHVKSRNGALPLKPEDFNRFNEIELRNHQWVNKRIEN